MTGRRLLAAGVSLTLIGALLLAAGLVVAVAAPGSPNWFGGLLAGSGRAEPLVAGTVAAPRVIPVVAGPGYTFTPSTITVQRGETVTFQVTTVGPLVHEFMVGPAADVAADRDGTPEIADIGMMETRSLTYTFDGSGLYAFACHATGHDEAGMKGTITVLG
jgi:uncharacterized cupredoxin-like copper-binding protein